MDHLPRHVLLLAGSRHESSRTSAYAKCGSQLIRLQSLPTALVLFRPCFGRCQISYHSRRRSSPLRGKDASFPEASSASPFRMTPCTTPITTSPLGLWQQHRGTCNNLWESYSATPDPDVVLGLPIVDESVVENNLGRVVFMREVETMHHCSSGLWERLSKPCFVLQGIGWSCI